MTEAEIERLKRIEGAAEKVILAAWEDRWGRLHGHHTVVALELAMKPAAEDTSP
jgi:hypothetical protein